MIRRAAIALGLLLATTPAMAEDCFAMRDRQHVDFFGWSDFFRGTPFGTVGFTRNDRLVYVPRPGVSCVTMPRSGAPLRFLFNHRGADSAAVSYVSFKLYGFKESYRQWVRYLDRRGPWVRGGSSLPDPWDTEPVWRNTPDVLSGYEAFYKGDNAATEAAFDQQFGQMHGKPKDSREDSWTQLVAMTPDPGTVDLSKAKYVGHELQRLEVSPGITTPGSPSSYVTKIFAYDTLVLRAFSPLEGGQATTLRIRWDD